DDTDLGALEVTVKVPALDLASVQRALDAGQRRAIELQRAGLIHSALLACQQRFAHVEPVEALRSRPSAGGRQVGRAESRGNSAPHLARSASAGAVA
ncbi:MAG: hypothetical protein ABIP61_10810, partial [Burkholderiaceae bacterium]